MQRIFWDGFGRRTNEETYRYEQVLFASEYLLSIMLLYTAARTPYLVPTIYFSDSTCIVEALRKPPGHQSAKVVIDFSTDITEEKMDQQGEKMDQERNCAQLSRGA